MKLLNYLKIKQIENDFLASLVVFVVAIPLSLGIAVASGAPPAAGLIAAIIGGVIVGYFSGAPLMVSGPAAGLTVLVFEIIQRHGIEGLAMATIACGIFQIFFGFFGWGWVFNVIPKGVLNGMLSAIGGIILIGQLHVLAGGSVSANPIVGLMELPSTYMNIGISGDLILNPVLWCGIVGIVIQITWPESWVKKFSIRPALPAVLVATLLSLNWEMARVAMEPIGTSVSIAFQSFISWTWMNQFGHLIVAGLGLAVVASAESLLTARAVNILKPEELKPNLDKELKAQGIGNFFSGMVGGLPLTGVIVRSAANVQSGGETRWSTIMHGFWVLLFVSILPFILTKIPLTALASVLVVTGVKLLNIKELVKTLTFELREGLMWIFTITAIVSTDLLMGLALSIGLSILINLRPLSEKVRSVVKGKQTFRQLVND